MERLQADRELLEGALKKYWFRRRKLIKNLAETITTMSNLNARLIKISQEEEKRDAKKPTSQT